MRAETEQKLVVGIPLIRGIRPVVVQPRPVGITFHLEHVRVAVGISIVRRAVQTTARLFRQSRRDQAVFYM